MCMTCCDAPALSGLTPDISRAAKRVRLDGVVRPRFGGNMAEKVTIGNAELWYGDCREILAGMVENSVNWCVTSPPYNLHKEHHTSPGAATAANAAMSAKYADW